MKKTIAVKTIRRRGPLIAGLLLVIAVTGCNIDWLDVFDTDGGGSGSDNTADVDDTDIAGLDVATSDYGFTQTYSNLEQAIRGRSDYQNQAVDLQARADDADQDIRPTRVILFADPNRMTPIIAADRRAGLDLPPAMLVYQTDDDKTANNATEDNAISSSNDESSNVGVAYNSRDYLAARYAVDDASDALDGLDDDEAHLVADASGNDVSRHGGVDDINRHDGIVDRTSDDDFDTTLDALVDAIEDDDDLTLLARFDHRQAAHRVGSMLDDNDDPSTLVVFDAGAEQARVIGAGQTAAVDLPVRILVSRDSDGTVHLDYNKPDYLDDRHDLRGASAVDDLDDTLSDLVDKVID